MSKSSASEGQNAVPKEKKNTQQYNTTLWPIVFRSQSLTSGKSHYGNIERKALGILHGLEKNHQYPFAHEVGMIMDHKPLVITFQKNVAFL